MPNGARRNITDAQATAREQLRWLLDEGGLSQRQLGERMGMLQPALSRMLHSQEPNTPSLPICRLINYVYNERRAELDADDTQDALAA